jgi:hypothetical protein
LDSAGHIREDEENAAEIRAALNDLRSLIPEYQGTFDIFHKTFADWLVDPPEEHTKYKVDPSFGRRRMAAYCKLWRETKKDHYPLYHAVAHLLDISRLDHVFSALDDAIGMMIGPESEFSRYRAEVLNESFPEFDDSKDLMSTLIDKDRHREALKLAFTMNGWRRDGCAVALTDKFMSDPEDGSARDKVRRIVCELLKLNDSSKPDTPSTEILNARTIAVRVATACDLQEYVREACNDSSTAVRAIVIPYLYRYWSSQREHGWEVLRTLSERTLNSWGWPRPALIEMPGHLSLAIMGNHASDPAVMAQLGDIWLRVVSRLDRSVLRIFLHIAIDVVAVALKRVLENQPAFQPLNYREMNSSYSRRPALHPLWQAALGCLQFPERGVAPLMDILMRTDLEFDLYLMMVTERAFIHQGMTDPKGVLDALYGIHMNGAPWFRQSGLYVCFHILRRIESVDDVLLDQYTRMTDEFFDKNDAEMVTASGKYSFSPHLAWPEVVFEKHRPHSNQKFISRYLEKAISLNDGKRRKDLCELCAKAAVLLSLVYQRHDRAVAGLQPLVGKTDKQSADLLVQTLANIRFQDEVSVDRFVDQSKDASLAARVRGAAPVIRPEDYPTWVDEFVVQSLISSPFMYSEICKVFVAGAKARSTRQALHAIVEWVLDLIARQKDAR